MFQYAKTYLAETSSHLLYQRSHRSDVDDFELVRIDRAVRIHVTTDFSQNAKQGHVRFAGTLEREAKSFHAETLIRVIGDVTVSWQWEQALMRIRAPNLRIFRSPNERPILSN